MNFTISPRSSIRHCVVTVLTVCLSYASPFNDSVMAQTEANCLSLDARMAARQVVLPGIGGSGMIGIDSFEVTTMQFDEFVSATGYRTVAERDWIEPELMLKSTLTLPRISQGKATDEPVRLSEPARRLCQPSLLVALICALPTSVSTIIPVSEINTILRLVLII